MILRAEQIAILDAAANRDYHERLYKHVLHECPELFEEIPEQEIRRRIDVGLGVAESYGFTEGEEQAAFTMLMFQTAPNFHLHPAMNAILSDTTIAQEVRLETMIELTSDIDWAEAMEDYDEDAWSGVDYAS